MVKSLSLIHVYCVLHAKRGGGEEVQIACKNAYIIYGRPLFFSLHFSETLIYMLHVLYI